MSIILEGGRKEQTSEQHCLVLPQTDHEQEPGPRHGHQQIYLPQINPGRATLTGSKSSVDVQSNLMSLGAFMNIRSDFCTMYNKDVKKSGLTSTKNSICRHRSLSNREELNSAQDLFFRDRW